MSKNKLYCYPRVSSQGQIDDGNSIYNQRHLGKKVSKSLDLEYVVMHEGGMSSLTERVGKDGNQAIIYLINNSQSVSKL